MAPVRWWLVLLCASTSSLTAVAAVSSDSISFMNDYDHDHTTIATRRLSDSTGGTRRTAPVACSFPSSEITECRPWRNESTGTTEDCCCDARDACTGSTTSCECLHVHTMAPVDDPDPRGVDPLILMCVIAAIILAMLVALCYCGCRFGCTAKGGCGRDAQAQPFRVSPTNP